MASKRENNTNSKVTLESTEASTSTSSEQTKQYPFLVRDNICEQLYLNPEMSDVSFLFPSKDDQTEANKQRSKCGKKLIVSIPAHKIFLKTRSEVFREMFNGTWKETKEVEIVDATPEEFKEFLQCFYLRSGTFMKQNIERVMYLADKYMIDDCLTACSNFLMDAMTLDDVIPCYTLSILYNKPNLKEMCEEKIKLNATLVFKSDDLLDCDRGTLAGILKLKLICRENPVFDGCMKWAKNICKNNGLDASNIENIRTQLGECLYLIRFGSMTPEKLSQCNLKYPGLLIKEELEDAKNCIGLEGYKSKHFVQIPRLYWYQKGTWRCYSPLSMFSFHLRSIESVQITSNKTTLLGGVFGQLIFRKNNDAFIKIVASIEIIEKLSESENVLFSGTMNFDSLGAYLKLPKPIIIKEGVKYEIRLRFNERIGENIWPSLYGEVKSPKGLQINFIAKWYTHLISYLEFIDL